MASSGLLHGMGDMLGSIFGARPRGARALRSVSEKLRWTAGMVIQWVENEEIRYQSRELLRDSLANFDADVVCAHSLGSLIAYDTFSRKASEELIGGRSFVSFGSQIGNPIYQVRSGPQNSDRCVRWNLALMKRTLRRWRSDAIFHRTSRRG